MNEQDKVKDWIERNSDIPYYILSQFNANCNRCGKQAWTATGLHWCVIQLPKVGE